MTVKIPIPLALVPEFVNTLDVETGADELGHEGALARWFEARGLSVGDATSAELKRAVRLREALRDLLLENNHVDVDASAARRLVEACARRGKVELRFSASGELAPTATAAGADGALGAVVAAVALSMGEGTWSRLKACRAETCHWAYYDNTRNRSRAWCSMEVCGNREKVRSYRRRHGHEPV